MEKMRKILFCSKFPVTENLCVAVTNLFLAVAGVLTVAGNGIERWKEYNG